MSNSLGDDAFCKNIKTTTITDINNSTGLAGQVLASTPSGIDWVVGSGALQDLQSVCTIGNITNTNIIMTAGYIQQDPKIEILTSSLSTPIKLGFASSVGTNGTIAIGNNTGSIAQADFSVAIGQDAGMDQQFDCVAIGNQAGQTQLSGAIAIGTLAGQLNQGNSIALGGGSGQQNQSDRAVAVGQDAGNDTQGPESVAIGYNAGFKQLAVGAVAIGSNALSNANGAGKDCIAIGRNAMDQFPQFNGNIILNSTGSSFPDFATYPPINGGRFYVAFIKADDGSHVNNQPLHYDTDTGEIYYL
jgi:hypothetical protein